MKFDSQEEKLKYLFEPPQNPEELDAYLKYWLKLDLPWDTVDPDSTSSPLKFIWSVYKTMLTGKGSHTHIVAASRNCAKTLTSSVVQFLSLLIVRRDGVHVAAELQQSNAAIKYLDKFLNIPELAPYINKDNVRTKMLINLPPTSFTDKNTASLQVITASKKGTNSSRASTLCFDECDLTSRSILEEAAYIGDPSRDRHQFNPIFIYLSSRKSNSGPLQSMLDDAEKNNDKDTRVHKWSVADFLKKCPPEVHKPENGKTTLNLHSEDLRTIWGKEEFEKTVPETQRSAWKQYDLFNECKTCPAFLACRGFSANQKGDSPGLRTREFTASIMKKVKDPNTLIAQSLNWKPDSGALVYRMFSRFKHVKDRIDFYEWAIGKKYNPQDLPDEELDRIEREGNFLEIMSITPTKKQIFDVMKNNGWYIVSGVDFGHSPDPAVGLTVGWHKKTKRAAIIHVDSENGYANHLWGKNLCDFQYKLYPPDLVAPDCVPDKSAPTYFKGYPALDTKPSSIAPGVSFIRGLLWDPVTQSSNFAILDDSEEDNKNIFVIEEFETWSHKKTPLGFDMSGYNDESNHSMDSLRYALAPFIEENNITISVAQSPTEREMRQKAIDGDEATLRELARQQQIKNQFAEKLQQDHGITQNPFTPQQNNAKKDKSTKGPVKFKF
jgi:hypothetical protein